MMRLASLTESQRALAELAVRHPVIVTGPRLNTARKLEAKLYGAVETGASGEVIFRLSQAGADAVGAL